MHDDHRGTQLVLFWLALVIVPASTFVAAASIATMQCICETTYRDGCEPYPAITKFFVQFGWRGFLTLAVTAIFTFAISTFRYRSLTAVVVALVILLGVFSFCMLAILASLLPYPWWIGSTSI